MTLTQTIILTLVLSVPVVALFAIARGALCAFRSQTAKRAKFFVISGLGIILMIGILAFVVVVWFAYAVAHTGKVTSSNFVVLASTAAPT